MNIKIRLNHLFSIIQNIYYNTTKKLFQADN